MSMVIARCSVHYATSDSSIMAVGVMCCFKICPFNTHHLELVKAKADANNIKVSGATLMLANAAFQFNEYGIYGMEQFT